MLVFKLAVLAFVAAVLSLALKKDQPAYAFLVSVCAVGGVLVIVIQQIRPVMEWLQALAGAFSGKEISCLLRVLGIAIVAQLTSDICKEAGMAAAATASELCGRICALFQAMPLLQDLLDSYAGYLQ